jgi:hypothetical protein
LRKRQRPPKYPQFPILGQGHRRMGHGIVNLTGRDRFYGRQDDVLPAEFQICGGGRFQPYRDDTQIVGPDVLPSRIPTDFYEQGLLGQGNSRFRTRDWADQVPPPLRRLEATGQLSMRFIETRPFMDEVTFPWIMAIQQETFAQFNQALSSQWSRM